MTKHYDTPKTPYQRLLERPDVDAVTKIALGENYRALNPAKIIKAQKEVEGPTSIRTFPVRQRPHQNPDIPT